MKRLLTLFILAITFSFANVANAQEDYSALNLFVSFGDHAAINGHYEIPIAKNLTVSPSAVVAFDFDYIALGGRLDYYFDSLFKLNEPWDIWGGVDAGFVLGDDDKNDDFSLNLHAGVEYKLNDTWGIIGEIGGGTASFGGIGVGIHF
ncbi:hypothetical protein [Namhaeicola litoreus]|uniref:Outer membrane protein beta-barrel domain-containing protein n=1 Tax=Namhaeicola litoreus TaxID=1052145 RepID=A0ABW3Y212_9FLAO